MSKTNNPIINNQIPRLNSNRYLTTVKENQKELAFDDENNIKNETPIEKTDNKTKKNNSNKLILFILLFLSLILISFIILMIGYFCFDWFKKKPDLVVQIKRDENLVTRYLETKKATNIYYSDKGSKIQNYTIETDFIVALNKKTKLSNFREIDYLYEAFLLIINISKINETHIDNLGGIYIYGESKSISDLLKINNELLFNISNINNTLNNNINNQSSIPFCKFYFYENGTLDEIYFPNDTNEFYEAAILDLIEKVTPKLSKSLYKNQIDKRRLQKREEGTYLDYEQIYDNNTGLNSTFLYEDKIDKHLDENNDDYSFENSELNSKMKRTFNSSGEMTSLDMEGEAFFFSNEQNNSNEINDKKIELNEEKNEKKTDTNESYYKLGYNQFKMNVSSNIILIQNKIEKNILVNLDNLSKLFKFEKSKSFTSVLTEKKGNEKEEISDEQNIIGNNEAKSIRNLAQNPNFLYSYNSTYRIVSTSFLGLYLGLRQGLYIDNVSGQRTGYINILIGNKEFTISRVDHYQTNYRKAGTAYKTLIDKENGLNKDFKPFGFLVRAELKLKYNAYHGVSFDILDGDMYVKSFSDFDISVEGSFGPEFLFFSFGVELTGNIAKGSAYIKANTLTNEKTDKALFYYYKEISSCSVDLSFYFTINLLFYKKRYTYDVQLYKGFSASDYYYDYC